MAERVILIKDIDLGAISTFSTDKVRVKEIDYKIAAGRLNGFEMRVVINAFNTLPSSRRYCSLPTRKILYMSIGGGRLSVEVGAFLELPMSPYQKGIYDALEEFAIKLRELLGLDKEFVPLQNEIQVDELALAHKTIREMKNEAWEMQRTIDELTKKISNAADNLRESAEKLK